MHTGLKIRFPVLGNVQCRAKFHVDFSETEGNFALYCTTSFTFPSMQIEGDTTFFSSDDRSELEVAVYDLH